MEDAKKKLNEQIRKQLEFYFSTANLQKDRFLKKEVISSKDGYVEVDMFTRFNKIQSLTQNPEDIIKAVKSSGLIKMDTSGKRVGRVTKFKEPSDSDDRTVYVEFLPGHASVHWVERVFKGCGKVVYVSLPKFKSTGDLKGFAFVEFEAVEQAVMACKIMNNPPASALYKKPGIFPRASKMEKQLEKKIQKTNGKNSKDHACRQAAVVELMETKELNTVEKEENKDERKIGKRKTLYDDIGKNKEDEYFINKKVKMEKEDSSSVSAVVEIGHLKSKSELKKKSCEKATNLNIEDKDIKKENSDYLLNKNEIGIHKDSVNVLNEKENNIDQADEKEKKIEAVMNIIKKNDEVVVENKNRNEKIDIKHEISSNIDNNAMSKASSKCKAQLRVIPKTEWLSLKQEYLQEQKCKMSCLKEKIKKVTKRIVSVRKTHKDYNFPVEKEVGRTEIDNIFGGGNGGEILYNNKEERNIMDKNNGTNNNGTKNNGTNNIDKDDNIATGYELTSSNKLTYIANSVLKITLQESVSKKCVKEMLDVVGESSRLAFIELHDDQLQGFVRVNHPKDAEAIMKMKLSSVVCCLLQGDEEKAYWQKIFTDRQMRVTSKGKRNKRGKDKVVKKADDCVEALKKNKHIIFL